MQELPRYDGREGLEMLRKNVNYYLHSKNIDKVFFIRWAELEKDISTAESLRKARAGIPS